MFGRKNKNQPPTRRTPAGLQSRQSVFSYHASRSVPEQPTGRQERRFDQPKRSRFSLRKLQNLPIYLSIGVMIFAFLYALTLNTNPIVEIVDDTSTSVKHPVAQYQTAASKLQQQSIFNQFKLTIDTLGIASELQQKFPEINTAEVTIPVLGRRAKVELTTISPAFVVTTSTGRSYYIASDGRATSLTQDYAVKPKASVTIIDQSGLPITPGKQVLTRDTVNFINQIIAQMQAAGVAITSFELPQNPYELRMRVEGRPYYVKFHSLGDARIQAGDFLAVRERLTGEGQTPGEYIDARVEGRVFYK